MINGLPFYTVCQSDFMGGTQAMFMEDLTQVENWLKQFTGKR